MDKHKSRQNSKKKNTKNPKYTDTVVAVSLPTACFVTFRLQQHKNKYTEWKILLLKCILKDVCSLPFAPPECAKALSVKYSNLTPKYE